MDTSGHGTQSWDKPGCRWCGVPHEGQICPKVKALEYGDDGCTVRRVEFFAPRHGDTQTLVERLDTGERHWLHGGPLRQS